MKGRYTAKVEKITILGRMNDINVQIEMSVDYPEGVSGIDIVKDITERWHIAGLEPPVPGRTTERTHSEKVSGANGTHPDDSKVYFWPGQTEPAKCPNCGKTLYYAEGIVKNANSSMFGDKWVKWFCDKKHGGCGGYNFDGKKEVRFDVKK